MLLDDDVASKVSEKLLAESVVGNIVLVVLGVDNGLLFVQGGALVDIRHQFVHVSILDVLELLEVHVLSKFSIITVSCDSELLSCVLEFGKLVLRSSAFLVV